MFVNFDKIFDITSSDIALDTNSQETSEFFSTYLNFWKIIAWIIVVAIANIGAWLIAGVIIKAKKFAVYTSIFLCLGGVYILGSSVFNYLLYRSGNSMPQYTSITRVSHAIYISKQSQKSVENLAEIADITKDKVVAGSGLPSDIVVVIGESHSVYHTSFMGYEVPTYPLITKRIENGEVAVMNDVVTTSAYTHGAMASIFSLSELGADYGSNPLFPMIFKSAGYYNSMYSNQYLPGDGISILGNSRISEKMFDSRNTKHYKSDGELAAAIKPHSGRNLIICHLMGQHYEYKMRYPHDKFSVFKSSDYKGSEEVKAVKAHYDNACLYNDFVLDQIISHFTDRDACVVYLSDHGEEVYEDGKFTGHGNAGQRPDIRYMIRVPMIIWASESFRNQHADKWKSIIENKEMPISTDDLPYILIDLAGIKTNYFDPSRSFINRGFNAKVHRIVMYSIDYDSYKK